MSAAIATHVSLAILYDTRVRPLTWAERGVLFWLSAIAATTEDGATVPFPIRAGEAPAAAWKRALGDDAAGCIGRLIEGGLLRQVDEGVRIVLTATQPPPAVPYGVGQGVCAPTPQTATQSRTGKPSDSAAAVRVRHDRSAFKARSKGWSRVPTGVSWETWVSSTEGCAFVASREAEFPGYASRVTLTMGASSPPGDAGGDAPLSPPHTPSLSPEKKEEERERARKTEGGVTPRVTRGGDAGGDAPRVTPPTRSLGEDLLAALLAAAKGNLIASPSPTAMLAAGKALVAMDVTDAEIPAMGAALADASVWWPEKPKRKTPGPVSLKELEGYRDAAGSPEWGPLQALVGRARGQIKRAAREAQRPPPPPSEPATPADYRTREQVIALRPAFYMESLARTAPMPRTVEVADAS